MSAEQLKAALGGVTMALTGICGKCKAPFIHSASDARWLCDECDGTVAARRKEDERWAALTPDQKCDELRKRVDGLAQAQRWDGRIG